MTDPIVPPLELVKKWQREANHNEPMFPQVAAMAAQWGYQQHEKALLDAMHSTMDSVGHGDGYGYGTCSPHRSGRAK